MLSLAEAIITKQYMSWKVLKIQRMDVEKSIGEQLEGQGKQARCQVVTTGCVA